MLQKIDKDRLDKVLQVLNDAGIRKVNSTLVRELGMDSGMVSNYLNGKKPISDNFYTAIIQKYGNDIADPVKPVTTEEDASVKTYNQKMEDAVYNLTVSNSNLAIAFVKQAVAQEVEARGREKEADARIIQATANKILVEVNRDTLLKIPNPQSSKEIQIQDSLHLSRTFEDLAKAGVPERWATVEDGLLFLSRLLHEAEEGKRASGMYAEKDSSNKTFS